MDITRIIAAALNGCFVADCPHPEKVWRVICDPLDTDLPQAVCRLHWQEMLAAVSERADARTGERIEMDDLSLYGIEVYEWPSLSLV